MGEHHKVNARQLTGTKGRSHKALGTQSADTGVGPDPLEEHRVGQDCETVKIDQNCGMPQPRGGYRINFPGGGSGVKVR